MNPRHWDKNGKGLRRKCLPDQECGHVEIAYNDDYDNPSRWFARFVLAPESGLCCWTLAPLRRSVSELHIAIYRNMAHMAIKSSGILQLVGHGTWAQMPTSDHAAASSCHSMPKLHGSSWQFCFRRGLGVELRHLQFHSCLMQNGVGLGWAYDGICDL